jgi:hypothetical protein
MQALHELPRSSDRSFGIVFAVVFFLVAAYPWVLGIGGLRLWATAIGVGFGAAAMIAPAMLAPLNKLWFRFGALLHAVVSPVVLGVMFYLVILPSALAIRVLGRDILGLRFNPQAKTYWITRESESLNADSFRDQF